MDCFLFSKIKLNYMGFFLSKMNFYYFCIYACCNFIFMGFVTRVVTLLRGTMFLLRIDVEFQSNNAICQLWKPITAF